MAGAFLTNPMSVAVDSEGNVFFSDWSGFIRKIRNGDGALTVVAGTGILGYSGDRGQATSAILGKCSIALDTAGNIYIADGDNNRIRRVDVTTGIITTIAGTGAAKDSSGKVYFADEGNNRIRVLTPMGRSPIEFRQRPRL